MTYKFLNRKIMEGRFYFINTKTKRLFAPYHDIYVKYELDYSAYGIIFIKQVPAIDANLPKGQYRPISKRYFFKKINSHQKIIELSCIAGKSCKIIKPTQI